MTPVTYTVKRRPGGWAVEFGDEWLCCYRTQQQAIAFARQLGHNGWHDGGAPAEIQVLSPTGRLTIECVYGQDARSA